MLLIVMRRPLLPAAPPPTFEVVRKSHIRNVTVAPEFGEITPEGLYGTYLAPPLPLSPETSSVLPGCKAGETLRIASPALRLPSWLLSTNSIQPCSHVVPVQLEPVLLVQMATRALRCTASDRAVAKSTMRLLTCALIRAFSVASLTVGAAIRTSIAMTATAIIISMIVNPVQLGYLREISVGFLMGGSGVIICNGGSGRHLLSAAAINQPAG